MFLSGAKTIVISQDYAALGGSMLMKTAIIATVCQIQAGIDADALRIMLHRRTNPFGINRRFHLAAIAFGLGATCICMCLKAAGRVFVLRLQGKIGSAVLLDSIAAVSQRRLVIVSILCAYSDAAILADHCGQSLFAKLETIRGGPGGFAKM